ncbi:MAG: hypothetical protein OXL41_13120 [Nitrospinae bacterium]|nr:hypothetical protein [Nitrospinota bacterium]
MSEKKEIEKRTDALLWRWAKGKHTVLRLIVVGAFLVSLGFILGGHVWRP